MILPILRLVLIYLLLVAGVVAVFNRDRLAPLLPGARDRAAAAETAPPDTPPQAEPLATVTAPDAMPVDGGQDTAAPVFPDAAKTEPTASGAPLASAPPPQQAPAQTQTEGQGAAPTPQTSADTLVYPAPLGTPIAAAPPATAPIAAAPATTEPATTAPPTTAPATTAPATLADAIAAARAAYWAGDIAGARAQMEALVAAHPDNPDIAGELGNLAFALRDYPAAAEAWHSAGLLLIDRGETARVMSFLPFLQSVAPDRAADLSDRLRAR